MKILLSSVFTVVIVVTALVAISVISYDLKQTKEETADTYSSKAVVRFVTYGVRAYRSHRAPFMGWTIYEIYPTMLKNHP